MRYLLLLCILPLLSSQLFGQRSYSSNSVLSSGNWYKISVYEAGIYKVDLPFLSSLGINSSNLSSASIRVFGSGGAMISEDNKVIPNDDLPEIAVTVVDGGDGIFNNQDYLIFYAPGPDRWIYDSINRDFIFQKNLYSDKSYYFISIGGVGKRIATNASSIATFQVQSYDYRFHHESDSINFLSSGKNWFGEEFSTLPGRNASRSFNLPLQNAIVGSSIKITSEVASRSAGSFSRFEVRINNASVMQQDVAFTGSGPYDPFAVVQNQTANFITDQPGLSVRYNYAPGNANAQGWLNYFEIKGRAHLNLSGNNELYFRDIPGLGQGTAGYRIQNANVGTLIWQISDILQPVNIPVNFNGNELSFNYPTDKLYEFVAFNNAAFKTPVVTGLVPNQNLHNSASTDILIITDQRFLTEANRLAVYHLQKDNLRSIVVTTSQIYNEFSSGSQDVSALRNFVKMYFDKAGSNMALRPKYLLLFGDGSFDYKSRINNNSNVVPAYQSVNSTEPLASYTSDDFFGFLDDSENINDASITNLLDIGIGRIPVNTGIEAKSIVDKIISYSSKESFGPWRNDVTFVADDEDNNLHLNDAESLAASFNVTTSNFNIEKIYLDAFRQESASGGASYPDVNSAITNKMLAGNLIWNYLGHGSYRRLADETILDAEMVNNFKNEFKLPLYITATCDFTPFDNPALPSLGESILLRAKNGGIALLSSSRVVFANSNKILNENFLKALTTASSNGNYPTLGEALKNAKNFNYQNYPDIVNNRKFGLLGDPALRIAIPTQKVLTTSINGQNLGSNDTLKALGKYIITGSVTDNSGNVLTGFNGFCYPGIYDKAQLLRTLANDAGSNAVNFSADKNIIYRGKVPVVNGKFSYSFIVPKDINMQHGSGRINYYAENGNLDGNGSTRNIIIGGVAQNAAVDNEGPAIKAYLNDEKFINGGLSNENPVLIIALEDSSGINATGIGLGHDITAVLDGDNRKLFELNAAYQAETGTYQKGKIHFQLPKMDDGPHNLKIKAWDVYNNSSEYLLEFRVVNSQDLKISNVLNYPNPFTSNTSFWFEHNRPGESLMVNVRIFTITGKLVRDIDQAINTIGNRSSEIIWNGRDNYGQKIGRGVYLYELKLSANGKHTSVLQKLVIL